MKYAIRKTALVILLAILISSCGTTLKYSGSIDTKQLKQSPTTEENVIIQNGFKFNLPQGWIYYKNYSLTKDLRLSVDYGFKSVSGYSGLYMSSKLDSYTEVDIKKYVDVLSKGIYKGYDEITAYSCLSDGFEAYIIYGKSDDGRSGMSLARTEGNKFYLVGISEESKSVDFDSSIAVGILASYESAPSEVAMRKIKGLPVFIATDGEWFWTDDVGEPSKGYECFGRPDSTEHTITFEFAEADDISKATKDHKCTFGPIDAEIRVAGKTYMSKAMGMDSTNDRSSMFYLFDYKGRRVLMTLNTYTAKSKVPTSEYHKGSNFIAALDKYFFDDEEDYWIAVHKKGERQNLGKNINSKSSELVPVISPDGNTMYLCRDHHPENSEPYWFASNQDIWISERDKSGEWKKAINIGKPLNTFAPNAVASVTPDGNTLLLLGTYKAGGEGLSISTKTETGWSEPQKLNIKNYYNNAKATSFRMSSDGKVIIMMLTRSDSKNKSEDLYASFLIAGNEWTEPINLGELNSDWNETAPFLSPDGETIYFSSDKPGGFGGADVYMSRRLDTTWKKWTAPENLGQKINTAGGDMYYTLTAKGDFVYFCANENSYGDADVFRMPLEEKFRPKPVILVSGKVFNSKTKKPLKANVFYETLPDGKEAGIANTNPTTGEYQIALPAGANYGFRAVAEGYYEFNENINAENLDEYKEITRNMELVAIEKGETFRLNNIFFDFGESALKTESFPELERLADFLKKNPGVSIEIAGHTDNVGSDASNDLLSKDRAKSVAEYILSKSIEERRIKYKGYGRKKPVATNDTEEGRAANRRVEFTIIEK